MSRLLEELHKTEQARRDALATLMPGVSAATPIPRTPRPQPPQRAQRTRGWLWGLGAVTVLGLGAALFWFPAPPLHMGHRASAAVAASSTTMPHRVTTPRPEQLQLLLHQAEAHLRAGRLEPAQTVYAQLLDSLPATQAEPAWRGMAAVALQMEADVTKTPLAAQVEARLRHGIALQPGKGFLHYALGNLCATGKRWIEAQQAFASAVAAEPDNPDYRFNLAISHERLRQPALALPHYQAALAGAESQPHSFNRRQAALRITALEH